MDRISKLPDSVLCHILSFLPTKHAVATSVLSTKWQFLWTNILNLDFDSSLCFNPRNTENSKNKMSFPEFVTRVLLLHNSRCIKTLRLKCGGSCERRHVDAWISTAISRNVEVLELCALIGVDRLPHRFFTCKTLVDLKLENYVTIRVPGNMCFPSLKKLQLISVSYDNDKSFTELISACLVLHELIIRRSEHDYLVLCNISSPVLKSLKLIFGSNASGFKPYLYNYKLKVYAPALEYLHLDDKVSMDFSIGELTSLVEADIHLYDNELGNDNQYLDSVVKFIGKLSQVKFLSLSINIATVNPFAFQLLIRTSVFFLDFIDSF